MNTDMDNKDTMDINDDNKMIILNCVIVICLISLIIYFMNNKNNVKSGGARYGRNDSNIYKKYFGY